MTTRVWRVAKGPEGTFTMTEGNEGTSTLTAESARHLVEQLQNVLEPDVEAWLKHGYDQGWCGPPVCANCDEPQRTVIGNE